jgi:3-oxoacyl-[acyl-carrier-protein] synthase III
MIARWSHVCIEAIAYELPGERVASRDLEARLAPIYDALRLSPGQLEALTGIRERRMWPPGTKMTAAAAAAGARALGKANIAPARIGAVRFGAVTRDALEPAEACAVAHALGLPEDCLVADVGNACLGVLSGMVEVANAIELGQIEAGLVVAAESSREIVDATIARLNATPTMEALKDSLATLTGGAAAVGVVLVRSDLSRCGHRLLGGAALSAPAHHGLCRWGPREGLLGTTENVASTDAANLLVHGVELGRRTFDRFLPALGWRREELDRTVCHQVGAGNRKAILGALGLPEAHDFHTYPLLGNTGSCALPMSAAIAEELGFLRPGHRVGFLGIGSGLNCLMLGVAW